MARRMKLAAKFSVPDLTTETIGIIGKRGSGKSHTGTLVVEELLDLDSQVIVIDPIGGWWGLRAGADGLSSGGFSIPIFGGLHGDIPLEERSGALLADYLVENRLSGVIDLSDFSKSAMRRFVREFAERFYQLKNKQRDPVHIVIDECDLFVPQRVDSQEMMPLVGAINDFVLRGRQRGIGVTLISQRPARINKDVLTQVEILIAFRLTGPQDIKAFGEWIEHNGTKNEQKEVLSSLSSLERGTGWFWAPGLMNGLLKQVAFRERLTYDSSRTPDGKKIRPPKTLRDVDLGQLSEAMKETVERAKSDDPKALKAEVMRLKKELQAGKFKKLQPDPSPTRIPKRIETPALTKRQEKRLQKQIDALVEALYKAHDSQEKAWDSAQTAHERAEAALESHKKLRDQLKLLGKTAPEVKKATAPAPSKKAEVKKTEVKMLEDVKHPLVCRKMLMALAQHPDGLTKPQILLHAGYASSGPVSTSFADILKKGWAGTSGSRLVITEDGTTELGDFDPLPTGSDLLDFLLTGNKLDKLEKALLKTCCDVYPEEISKSEILDRARYKSSGPVSTAFAKLVRYTYLVSSGRSMLRASEALFDPKEE